MTIGFDVEDTVESAAKPKRRNRERLYVADASVSATALEGRLAVLLSDSEPEKKREAVLSVQNHVTKAREAAAGHAPRTSWLSRTAKGALIEAAYLNYHAARVVAVEVMDQAQLRAELPGAVARTRRYLDRDDPRRSLAERLLQTKGYLEPAAVRSVLEAGYEAADNHHRAIRGFRNIIYVALAGILLLLVVVAVLVTKNPDALPFCFSPQEAAQATVAVQAVEGGDPQPEQATGTGVQVYCPTGSGTDRQPSPLDIWVVLGMGTIGGSLASMVSIRNMTASTSPYDVPVALSRLKVPAGALTAMIGLIALRGGFVPGLSELDSQQQIIAYALVFGYAQQLATGFLDQRAQKLQETDVAPVPTSNGLNGGGTPSGPGGPGDDGRPPESTAVATT